MLARDPELASLSELNTELQIALTGRAERRLRALARRSPPGVRLDRGLAELFNPASWSEDDESELLRRQPSYADIVDEIAELRPQVDGRPDWPALRTLFRSEIRQDPSVAEAQAELEQAGQLFLQEARSCRQSP